MSNPALSPFKAELYAALRRKASWKISALCGEVGRHSCIVHKYLNELVREGLAELCAPGRDQGYERRVRARDYGHA